jgi:Sulfotransferase domain
MWSGPRNISTALLRSWGNRSDTSVVDEPLYAHYLWATGLNHPARDEVIASQPTDWRKVVAALTGPIPGGKSIYYQKHMTHHLLPQIDRGWLGQVTNCFLIRHPRDMITSYVKIRERPTLADTGFVQQREIFDWVRQHRGVTPPVIDAADVLNEPRKTLGLLCDALGVPFEVAMLSWPAGPRATDGVWASHWYGEVAKSTGFRPYKPKNEPVPDDLADIYQRCLECYEPLYEHRLR